MALAYPSAQMALACSCELQMGIDRSFRAERLVQVHGAAAGDQKHMLHALFGNEAHNVIGKLHEFNRNSVLKPRLRFNALAEDLLHTQSSRQPAASRSAHEPRRCRLRSSR